jgi:hypothetical protein
VRPTFDQTHGAFRYVFSDGANVSINFQPSSKLKNWKATVKTVNGTYRIISKNLTWNPDTWHLLTFVYNGSDIRLYWDGVLNVSGIASGNVAADSGATYLGRAGVSDYYFSGAIDELKVYDYAISDSQISNLFSNP